MKGKTLIWIILLNIFDSSVCSTNVWLHKLILDLDAPFHCSPQTVWKVRLRIQQSNNRSGLHRDIWRKAEAKLCSSQMVTFGILLFTTENCTLLSSYPMTLSLYLLERQSVGLDLKKSWNFHLPVDCGSLKTILTIGEVIRLNDARIYVGYENGSRKSRQPDTSVNKITGKPVLTDAILPGESQLFENGARHSKRFSDNISPEKNDSGKGKVLRGDNKLFLDPFKKSNSELNHTPLELLQEATKLRQKFLRVAFSVSDKNTQSTRKINEAKNVLNILNGDDTFLRIQLLGKTLPNQKQSERLNNDASIPHKKIDSSSTLTHLFNTKYTSSTPSLPFYLTSTDDKILFISSSIRTSSNIKSNITTDLPVVEYSSRLTSKQEKETALPNTKPSTSSHQTVTSKMTPFKASTTVGMSKRTLRQQELSPFPITGKADIITTDLMPKEGQNASTSHKTTGSKDTTSTLRTPWIISTLVESTMSSSTPKWKQTSPGQPTTQKTTRMSSQNGSDDHSLIISTSLFKTSTPTKTTTMTTSPSKTSKTTTMTTSPSKTSKTTTMTTSPSKTSKTTTMTTSPSKTSKTTTMTTSPSKTSKTTTMTTLLSSLPTTLKASTMISKIATTEFSTRSSHSLTTSPTSDLWVTITSTYSIASTNESINSTSADEITTFLPHHTDKNPVKGDEDDTYFWPVVLSLVIGIPAIIVFSIAMVVILRKRNIDSSTFFLGSAIGDEEV